MTRPAATVLAIALAASAAHAQARPPKPAPGGATPDGSAEDAARQRRANAMFLLVGLADDAAKYDDTRLRARIQARVADALWSEEHDRAVALFVKAWESAEA